MSAFLKFLEEQAASLPRQHVPPLLQTMTTLLRSVKPLVSEDEYKNTENLIKEFSSPGGIGENLQRYLEERAANTDNWLEQWWLNAAYLESRCPVSVHSNIVLAYEQQNVHNKQDQLKQAAALAAGLLDFVTLLFQNKVPVERIGPIELDMSQYLKVFSTCRIPGENIDTVRVTHPDAASQHIIVGHNNHFFAVPVYDGEGKLLNQAQIMAQMIEVVNQSAQLAEWPVGILTAENRTTWSRAREALIKADKVNGECLDLIETSLFVILLDGAASSAELAAPNFMTRNALKLMHGGGSTSNSANRWFDHVFQFAVGLDGEVGLCAEHAPGDAHPIITDHAEMYWKKYGNSADPVPPAGKFSPPRKLQFVVPTNVQAVITSAQINVDRLTTLVDVYCFTYTDYGKDFIKVLQLGTPDSYIQMAIQLAFYKLHNESCAQYETATTRKFLFGRTETIRSCSTECVEFVHSMVNTSVSNSDKIQALRSAMKGHRDYVMGAMMGHGVDRHLLGLRLAAKEQGMAIPKFFSDAGYLKSGHMRVSTSQVPSAGKSCGIFAPMVMDGYGCCYNPRAADIIFGVTTFTSCADTSARKFALALTQALGDIKQVVSSLI